MMQCHTNRCQSPLNLQVWTSENSKEGERERERETETETETDRRGWRDSKAALCTHVAEYK